MSFSIEYSSVIIPVLEFSFIIYTRKTIRETDSEFITERP